MFRALTSPMMLGLHLLAAAATTAAVLLGLWQLGVWHDARMAQARQLSHATPVPLSRLMSPDSPYPANAVGRPVSFKGIWLPQETLYVRGRMLHGHRGFWAVTPVAVCRTACSSDHPAILVVRGWTPRAGSAPAAPSGRVRVTGWLQPAEGGGVPDQNPRDHVLSAMRLVEAIPHVRQDLYEGYVIAKHPAASTAGPAVLTPVTPASLPQPSGFTSLRNLLYAFEWWIFGGFAVFLWWRWCSDEVKRVTEEDAGIDEGTDEGSAEPATTPTGPRTVTDTEVSSKP